MLDAPSRYPREHGRYGRTEEDESDGVLVGFGHGLGRSKSSAPPTLPLAVRLLVITSSTTQNLNKRNIVADAEGTHDGFPIGRDVARICSTTQPLSGGVQFERSV